MNPIEIFNPNIIRLTGDSCVEAVRNWFWIRKHIIIENHLKDDDSYPSRDFKSFCVSYCNKYNMTPILMTNQKGIVFYYLTKNK